MTVEARATAERKTFGYLSTPSKMFNMAEVWGLRPDGSNPCRHVPKYREEKRERYLGPYELQQLGEVLFEAEQDGSESVHVVAAFRLLILTGCRLREIQTLRWDFVTDNGMELPDTKSGARRILLPAAARAVLSALPRTPGNPYVIEGNIADSHITDLRPPWQRLRARTDLEDVRIHEALRRYSEEHPKTLEERLPKAGGKYRWT